MSSTYNQLRLRIHEILTYAINQWETYPIARVRPWPTPEDPNTIITDDGLILHMTVTEYEQYLERPLEEISGDRCFEWIDRVEEAEEI